MGSPLMPSTSANELAYVGNVVIDSTEDVLGEAWLISIRWNIKLQYSAGILVTKTSENQYKRIVYCKAPDGVRGSIDDDDRAHHNIDSRY